MKKYKLTNETREVYGHTLYRIEATRDFGNVEAGEKGGWIESEQNLSHDGDCWVYDRARVWGQARVYGNAQVYDNATVGGNAQVYEEAWVYNYGSVCGNAHVKDEAQVYGNATVCGDEIIYEDIH